MQVLNRRIDELRPSPRNARNHPPEQVKALVASLLEWGWTKPVIVTNSDVVAGHGILLAAKEVRKSGKSIPNWPDTNLVPTIDQSHLTPTQIKAYMIADNQLSLRSGWMDDVLSSEMAELFDAGYDLNLIGFEPDEVADMFGIELDEGEEKPEAFRLRVEFSTKEERQEMIADLKQRGIKYTVVE